MAAASKQIQVSFSEHEVIITAASSLCSSLPPTPSVFDFLGVLRVARAQHRDTPPILVPQGSPALTVRHISSTLLNTHTNTHTPLS